jgi:hypothetical protein
VSAWQAGGMPPATTGPPLVDQFLATAEADPGPAIRARAQATLDDPADAHDPEGVWAAYLSAAVIFQL